MEKPKFSIVSQKKLLRFGHDRTSPISLNFRKEEGVLITPGTQFTIEVARDGVQLIADTTGRMLHVRIDDEQVLPPFAITLYDVTPGIHDVPLIVRDVDGHFEPVEVVIHIRVLEGALPGSPPPMIDEPDSDPDLSGLGRFPGGAPPVITSPPPVRPRRAIRLASNPALDDEWFADVPPTPPTPPRPQRRTLFYGAITAGSIMLTVLFIAALLGSVSVWYLRDKVSFIQSIARGGIPVTVAVKPPDSPPPPAAVVSLAPAPTPPPPPPATAIHTTATVTDLPTPKSTETAKTIAKPAPKPKPPAPKKFDPTVDCEQRAIAGWVKDKPTFIAFAECINKGTAEYRCPITGEDATHYFTNPNRCWAVR